MSQRVLTTLNQWVGLLAVAVVAGWSPGPALVSAQSAAVSGPRLYVFHCGTLKQRNPATYNLTPEQVESNDMSDPCFLVVHPKGSLLWETGLNDATFNKPEGGDPRGDKVDKSLKSQLAEIGYAPGKITYLAISHLHGDHSGNVGDYAGSTWIVQKAERRGDVQRRRGARCVFEQLQRP